MSITAADIRREIKEKNVTFLRLMFSDIMGIMKNVEIPATDEQVDKVLSNKAMFDGSSIEGFVRINPWAHYAAAACGAVLVIAMGKWMQLKAAAQGGTA